MDGFYILGPPDKILKAYKLFAKRCEEDKSLDLNLDKGKMIYFHSDGLSEHLKEEAKTLELKLKSKAVKILGAPVGIDEKAVSDLAVKITSKYKIMFDRLKNEKIPDYVCDQILRMLLPKKLV